MKYSKPALTVEQQIALLKSRNLIIEDEDEASITLSNISYYRLSSYLYPFRIDGDENQCFKPGSSFNEILKFYSFDRKLRLLSFDAIERIEIAFRAQFVLKMALKYGPFWYYDDALFLDNKKFQDGIEFFQKEFDASDEVFIRHYKNKYSEPELPPAWMGLEIFTIGRLSKHYTNLKYYADKKMMARYFGLTTQILDSWLHSLNYLRNICAHHSRLWNRNLRIKPQIPKFGLIPGFEMQENDKAYALLNIMNYLLNIVHPKNTFRDKIINLLSEYPQVNPMEMGFPDNWHEAWIKVRR